MPEGKIPIANHASAITAPNGRSSPQAHWLLAFMVAMMFCLELARLPLVLLVDPIRGSFGISDLQASLLLGVFSSTPFVLMSLIGGWLSDRLSRKLLLVAAAATWVAGAMLCAMSRDYGQLATGRVLVGLGAGMKLPIAITWINDAFSPERRGRAIGAFFIVLGSGPSLAVILAGMVQKAAQHGDLAWIHPFVGAADPWRRTVFALTLPTVVVTPLVLGLADRRTPWEREEPFAAGSPKAEPFVLGAAILIVLAASLIAFVDASNLGWFSTLMIRSYGFSPEQAGGLFGAGTLIAGFAGPLIGGLAGDYAFRRYGAYARPALAGVAALTCAPILLTYLMDQPTVLGLALTASGICTVTALSLSYVTVQAALPPGARGLGTGAMSASTTLVGSAGPTAVALVSRSLFSGATLAPAIALVGGFAALASGFLLLLTASMQRFGAARRG